jgi:hypothetical protein
MDAYCKGLNGAQASWANKKYDGHHTPPLAIMSEIPHQEVVLPGRVSRELGRTRGQPKVLGG